MTPADAFSLYIEILMHVGHAFLTFKILRMRDGVGESIAFLLAGLAAASLGFFRISDPEVYPCFIGGHYGIMLIALGSQWPYHIDPESD